MSKRICVGTSDTLIWIINIFKIDPTFYVSFKMYIWRKYLFNNSMLKFSGIYVSTTGYLLHLIYFRECCKNSQQYMLDNPDFNNISIENYKWERLPVFMLSLYVFVASLLTLVYAEVIANIQCYLFYKRNTVLQKINTN